MILNTCSIIFQTRYSDRSKKPLKLTSETTGGLPRSLLPGLALPPPPPLLQPPPPPPPPPPTQQHLVRRVVVVSHHVVVVAAVVVAGELAGVLVAPYLPQPQLQPSLVSNNQYSSTYSRSWKTNISSSTSTSTSTSTSNSNSNNSRCCRPMRRW